MPGTKLSEETVADALDVSRPVVRAALNRLHSEALVELKKNRGAFVASPSIKEAQDVFDVRILLEKEVAARLGASITTEQLDELERHIAHQRECHRAGRDAEAMRLAEVFHLMTARMAGNQVLQGILDSLISRTSLVLGLYSRSNTSECGIEEHEAIIETLRREDPAEAAAVMTRHLERVFMRAKLSNDAEDTSQLTDILSRYAKPRGAA